MKTIQLASRSSRIILRRSIIRRPTFQYLKPITYSAYSTSATRSFTSTPYQFKGLQPDTSDPKPPNPTAHDGENASLEPADLSEVEYGELADQYLETLEQLLQEKAEGDLQYEAEYSAGVLTITTPGGTYVINKQPPNKQIWLSSPSSGPKRYDWVVRGQGQSYKEGTETEHGDDGNLGGGKWIYLRDGSSLTELLRDEIGVDVAPTHGEDAVLGREGPGGSGTTSNV